MAYRCDNQNGYPVIIDGIVVPSNGSAVVSKVPALTTAQRAGLTFTLTDDPVVDNPSAALEAGVGNTSGDAYGNLIADLSAVVMPPTPIQVAVSQAAVAGDYDVWAIARAANPNTILVNEPTGPNQTAAVQAAIDALATGGGGKVVISNNTKFSLRDLVFPAGASRTILEYRIDDEINQNGPPSSGLATSERVTFMANANTDGIVNEHRLTGAFHPAWIVDVRKDIPGQDGSLGPGQTRTNPARAGYLISDERLGQIEWLYTRYPTQSGFNTIAFKPYLHFWTINGIGTNHFVTAPALGTVITGATSGAKGLLTSITTTSMTLIWMGGAFVVGETVTDNDETSSGTISSRTYSTTPGHDLATGLENGYWGIGVPLDKVKVPFTVGGGIAVAPTRSMSQYLPNSTTVPKVVWQDSVDVVNATGAEIQRNLTNGKLLRTKLGESTPRAHVDAITCHGNIYSTGAWNTIRSFNIGNVEKIGTGHFRVTFVAEYDYNDYSVVFGTKHPLDYAYFESPTTTTVDIKCVITGTSTLKDPTGSFIYFAILGNAPV